MPTVILTAPKSNCSADSLLPGMGLLGYGYDVFSQYASVESGKGLAIDGLAVDPTAPDNQTVTIGENSYSYPPSSILDISQDITKTESHEYGSSFQELTKNINASVSGSVNYGVFSASLDTEYSSSTRSSSNVEYDLRSLCVTRLILSLQKDQYSLTESLQTELDALDCTDNSTVEGFFQKYGTHVVTGLILGGTCSYAAHSSETESESSTSFQAHAETCFKYASGEIEWSSEVEEAQKYVTCDTNLQVVGGDTSKISPGSTEGYSEWVASVKNEPEIVAFTSGSLKPIWEFCTDSTQQEALQSAFNALYSFLRSTSSNIISWASDGESGTPFTLGSTDEIIVGFGATIGSGSHHYSKFAYRVENISTQARDWRARDSSGNKIDYAKKDYETIGEVPAGFALTGMALKGGPSAFTNMRLYMQPIDPTDSANNFLGTNISHIDFQGQEEKSNDGVSFNETWNPDDHPEKQYVVYGIKTYAQSSGGSSHQHISSLGLYQSKLQAVADA